MDKATPLTEDAPAHYGYLEYDVSCDFCLWLICFPIHFGAAPFKTILNLEPEEVVKRDTFICGSNNSRRPYGELGSVDIGNCCCFVHLQSNFGPVSPGCGCNTALVTEIVEELKKRMKSRGDTGQIRRTEQLLGRINGLEAKLGTVDAKLDVLMKHLNIHEPVQTKLIEDRF
mmetsp:Transcript_14394/g.18822  ORF Transcript_14394/g.18822 Transcript_14394/m.18822 type:complete len:172 (-) Transcript_14394:309-824(-)